MSTADSGELDYDGCKVLAEGPGSNKTLESSFVQACIAPAVPMDSLEYCYPQNIARLLVCSLCGRSALLIALCARTLQKGFYKLVGFGEDGCKALAEGLKVNKALNSTVFEGLHRIFITMRNY
eukprot:6184874-Pleurochrysis_carterae.AAC.2